MPVPRTDNTATADDRAVAGARGEKMERKQAGYRTVANPKMRRWFAAAFRSVQHTPMIHGLIEVDVTRACARLREHRASTGESLSFTAFVIACLARAVDENKAV